MALLFLKMNSSIVSKCPNCVTLSKQLHVTVQVHTLKTNCTSFSGILVHIPDILRASPRSETLKLMWVSDAGPEPSFTVIIFVSVATPEAEI